MHNVKVIITHRETKYFQFRDLREGRGGLSSVDVSPKSAVVTVSFHRLWLQVRAGNVNSPRYNMLCFFFSHLGTPASRNTGGVAKSSILALI